MPKSKSITTKDTGKPPYKMRSTGTKWGIPPDSPASTSGPAPADSVALQVGHDDPAKDKQEILETGGTAGSSRDEVLPKPEVEVDGGSTSAAQQPSVQKKARRKSKSAPVGTTKRGRGRPRGRVTIIDDEFVPYEWGAFDGMSADDADAKMARIFRGLTHPSQR